LIVFLLALDPIIPIILLIRTVKLQDLESGFRKMAGFLEQLCG